MVDQDFYEWETHFFFDDAFEHDYDEEEQVVNKFVTDLVGVMDEAATLVHCKNIKVGNEFLRIDRHNFML